MNSRTHHLLTAFPLIMRRRWAGSVSFPPRFAASLSCFFVISWKIVIKVQSAFYIFVRAAWRGSLFSLFLSSKAAFEAGRNENVAEMNCAAFISSSSLPSFFVFMRENIGRIWQKSFFARACALLPGKWRDKFTHLLEGTAKDAMLITCVLWYELAATSCYSSWCLLSCWLCVFRIFKSDGKVRFVIFVSVPYPICLLTLEKITGIFRESSCRGNRARCLSVLRLWLRSFYAVQGYLAPQYKTCKNEQISLL